MEQNKIFIWSHADMDGCGCIMLLKWLFETHSQTDNYDIKYKVTTAKNFRDDILTWIRNDSFLNYDHVYICDLDISKDADIVDYQNVTIIDHHKSHADWLQTNCYKNATVLVEEYSSASQYILDLFFKNNNGKLPTKYRQLLIKLIDDYDSYTLKYKQSRELNIIFWSFYVNRDKKFIETFYDGFKGFDKFQQFTIAEYEKNLKFFIDNIQLYECKLVISDKPYKCVAVMADKMIDDISSYLLTLDCDLAFVVNTRIMSVSIRKQEQCDMPLNKFAERFGGGGHEYAGGFPLTDTFQLLLKRFKKRPK